MDTPFYLRNLLLNQTIFIAMLAALLLLPRILVWLFREDLYWAFAWVAIGIVLLLLSYGFTGCNLRYLESLSGEATASPSDSSLWYKSVVRFLSGHIVALLTFLAGLCVITGWWKVVSQWPSPAPDKPQCWVANLLNEAVQWSPTPEWQQALCFMVGGAGLYFVLWLLALGSRSLRGKFIEGEGVIEDSAADTTTAGDQKIPLVRWPSSVLLWSLVSGAVGGLMLYGLHRWLLTLQEDKKAALWLVAGPGVGLIVTLFLLVVNLHIGLVGRSFSTDIHEWWSRVGASMLLLTLGWVTLVIVAIFAPPTVVWLWHCNGSWIVSGAGTWWSRHCQASCWAEAA